MLFHRPVGGHLLIGAGLATLIACGSPPEEIPAETPRPAAEPEAAEAPRPDAQAMDPMAAARVERVRQSLEQGLDVNKPDPEGRTAIMMAAFEGFTEVVAVLLEYGAEVDRRDAFGRTALMYAASGPYPRTVELLIDSGADINHADSSEGWTALMLAAAEGHRPVVELLLTRGADVKLTDQDGDSAAHHARERGQTEIVTLLEAWPEES